MESYQQQTNRFPLRNLHFCHPRFACAQAHSMIMTCSRDFTCYHSRSFIQCNWLQFYFQNKIIEDQLILRDLFEIAFHERHTEVILNKQNILKSSFSHLNTQEEKIVHKKHLKQCERIVGQPLCCTLSVKCIFRHRQI